jgi:anti-sigma factor (TIGR02949 family)
MSDASETMRCVELVEVITDYLEGKLPASQRTQVERHLASCPGCANYVQKMRETIRLSGRLRDEAIPNDVRARMLAAFRGFVRRQQP